MNARDGLTKLVLYRFIGILLRRSSLTELQPFHPQSRSVFIRYVDAGSANDNEIESSALWNPIYDAEHYGRKLVASPRHADVLLVSLPLTRNMSKSLRLTWQAMPTPATIVSLGDQVDAGSLFKGSYAVKSLPEDLANNVYKHIADFDESGQERLPPNPESILRVLLEL